MARRPAGLVMAGGWTNWSRCASCEPVGIETVASEEEIVAAVRRAAAAGRRVKVVGTGHSFNDIACTDGHMLRLDGYDRVLDADLSSGTVTVQAGITIARLGEELFRRGLAQESLGDVAYQTIAGAISTATHGKGARLGNIATQVVALTLVLADGSLLRCSAGENRDIFPACQVSLGALGVISTVTLRCLPAFNLRSAEEPRPLDDVLDRLDEFADGNDFFEFFWFPHTDRVQSIVSNRTEAPARPRGRTSAYLNDILLENHAFGLICRTGRVRPGWIPFLNRFAVRMLSRGEIVDRSARIFANPRLVRFVEMEYAVPRAAAREAIEQLRTMIDRQGHRISFPVEVRFGAADDIMLSPGHGRESCYISVHVFVGMRYERYFRDVEAIMTALDGRPHWGKVHYQTADTLRSRYPQWDRFLEIRGSLDPERRFGNAYLDRVFG